MIRLWGNYFRIIIVLISFLCLVSVCSNYIIINFTFICMKDDFSEATEANGTLKSIYDYTPTEKKYILWAVAFGTMIGTFPINVLYVKYGARIPFFSAGVLSALTTGFTPWAAGQPMWIFVILRFLQGVAYSADFAAIGIVISKWASLNETAIFIATLTSFTSIASIITNGVSGVICDSSLGWKWSFYLHAVVCFFVFSLWVLIYKDDPTFHKSVSVKELGKIQKNKSEAHIKDGMKVPYKAIFTSPVVLTVWLCAFTELSTLIMIATYAPIYFRSVLKFDIKIIGFYLGIMTAIHIPFRFVCAFLSDKMKFVSEILKIHIFNTLAVGFVGISFVVFGQIPPEHNISAVVCLAILECFISFNSGGFYKCGTLHSRQFASTVISAIQFTKCISLFSGPALVAFFVTDESNQTQWSHVFMTLAGFTFVANILSFIFFTDKPAKWTEDGGTVKYTKKEEDTVKSFYDYTPIEKKYILWAVAFGTIVGIFPINVLYVRFGARIAFFTAGILSAITTGFTPWAASYSMWFLVALRFLQGVAYSADFAAIGIVISKWAPLDETAVFIATLTSFTSISSIITNGVSGVICESDLGWKWSFYFHAAACFFVFMTWGLVYKDDPSFHKSVSAKELGKIQKNKTEAHIKDDMKIPYRKIFTSPVVITVWLCAFTELSTLILIATYAPIYFRSVLGFDIKIIGFYLGIMLAIHLPFRFVCAFLSDKTSCISEMKKIHIFNTLAVGFVGVSFIVFSQIPPEQKIWAVICLAILECFTSFNSGGFYKCGTLHARQFSSIVISAIQFTKCISLFSGPALVAFFVTDESNQTQWSHVFMTLAGFTFVANIFSFIFFTDQPAEWTEDGGAVKYSKKEDIVKI
ncbi:hypothetical protein CAEBREN_28951 [Caenorhabditis brenneri]|uniref:Major facilitator superfamily (MFS) profile domain-containing protein n=1 Tax=Caenorhabditis brenneri TaxID=135651 RepID=G0NYN5_CAEBE|nr:hypothetical protein CAEBREN_28951 [Caenorhabditis brenneri]